jgi:hypothetical protein
MEFSTTLSSLMDLTAPIAYDDARAQVTGRTEKPGGVDPARQIDAGEGNKKQYRLGRVPLDAFAPNESGDRYDGTVDMKRASDYQQRDPATAPPVIAVISTRTGKLNILDGGHRITAARMRGDHDILTLIAMPSNQVVTLDAAHVPRDTAPTKPVAWSLQEAEAFLLVHEDLLSSLGFRAEVVGSVRTRGFSCNDLDILLHPIAACTMEDAIGKIESGLMPTISIDTELHLHDSLYGGPGGSWFANLGMADGRVVEFYLTSQDFPFENEVVASPQSPVRPQVSPIDFLSEP